MSWVKQTTLYIGINKLLHHKHSSVHALVACQHDIWENPHTLFSSYFNAIISLSMSEC